MKRHGLFQNWILILVLVMAFLGERSMADQNPLPNPTHPMLFGYYFVGSRIDEVSCYTNLYRAGAPYNSGVYYYDILRNYLIAAHNAGMHIILSLNMSTNCEDAECKPKEKDIDRVLNALKAAKETGTWESIEYVELTDEPQWTLAKDINQRIETLINIAASLGMSLDHKKIGVNYKSENDTNIIKPVEVANSDLNYVSIEAFLELDSQGAGICNNADHIRHLFNSIIPNVGDKEVFMVMMAYGRNGWSDIQQLIDLQTTTYLYAARQEKVKALTMFAYDRTDGTLHIPGLIAAHKQIGEKILATAGPHPACGPAGQTPYVPLPDCGPDYELHAPGNLTAAGRGNLVDLTWQDNSDVELGFELERKVQNSGIWEQIAVPDADQTKYTDAPTPPVGDASVGYVYRIRAFNKDGESAYSNAARITLYNGAPTETPKLLGPSGCIDTLHPTFSWTPVARATRYYLAVSAVDGSEYPVDINDVQGTSYTANVNFTAGLKYKWKVKACNNQGCTAWAPFGYLVPFCAPSVMPQVTAPLGCVAITKPTLTWTAVPGATYYSLVLQRMDPTKIVTIYNNKGVVGTSFTLPSNLIAGREYRLKVKGMNAQGAGPYSNYRYFIPNCAANQKVGTASPIAPGAAIILTNPNPVFSWDEAATATDYNLTVKDVATGVLRVNNLYQAAEVCEDGTCAVASPMALPIGKYIWQIESRNSSSSSLSLTPKFSIADDN